MQITDLYQTKITCSTYNANIDSTDTVITVKLIDFNGNAVTNKSVTLTCDKGYFNKNGSTTISGTTTKSITATTNSSGEITATWTASEWGLCTFSANTENIQVKTKGWKLVHTQTVSGVTLNVYSDGIIAEYFFKGDVTVNSTSLVLNFNTNYAPIAFIIAPLMQWDYCRLAYDGNLTITKINTASNNLHVQTGFTGILKTPLY